MKLLAFAYACEPDKGSEPGAGWAWARLLARFGDVWVITRENNSSSIEKELPRIPEAGRLHFVYVDLPEKLRFWKRGQRGVRLYYFLWQLFALRRAKRLRRETGPFDLVWHLTLANIWMGSVGQRLGDAFVFGPVGGGARAPKSLISVLGLAGRTIETARGTMTSSAWLWNPLARGAVRDARLILVQNEETRAWVPVRYKAKVEEFPNTMIDLDAPSRDGRSTAPAKIALFAGELRPLKGVHLAIQATALSDDWRLIVCGSGGELRRLKGLAGQLGVANRVEFRGWLARDELFRVMREEADVFLFPSLRDQASWAMAEALANGLPVVALDSGGSRSVAGEAGVVVSAAQDSAETARALCIAMEQAWTMDPTAPLSRARELSPQRTFERLNELLTDGGLVRADSVD